MKLRVGDEVEPSDQAHMDDLEVTQSGIKQRWFVTWVSQGSEFIAVKSSRRKHAEAYSARYWRVKNRRKYGHFFQS